MKPRKPLNKFWNRSPFIYKLRYNLLSQKIALQELYEINYNSLNPSKSIPQIYYDTNKLILKDSQLNLNDFDKVIQIATWLRNNISGGKGLGINSEDALLYMLNGSYGICSDFCQIFNNFCVINGIKVREWGVKQKNSYTDGHSFNEFFSKELNKWILLDVSGSIYFATTAENGSKIPLSSVEVFNLDQKNTSKETVFYNSKYKIKDKLLKKFYYLDKMNPFIVDNYNNKFYDTILKRFSFLPIPFIHGIAIFLNKSYRFKFVCVEQ